MKMDFRTVKVEPVDNIAVFRMDNPPVNQLSEHFVRELGQLETIITLGTVDFGWLAIAFIGIGVSGVAYLAGNKAYEDKAMTAELYNTFITFVPVLGLIWSYLLGEVIDPINYIGAALVIVSIFIANKAPLVAFDVEEFHNEMSWILGICIDRDLHVEVFLDSLKRSPCTEETSRMTKSAGAWLKAMKASPVVLTHGFNQTEREITGNSCHECVLSPGYCSSRCWRRLFFIASRDRRYCDCRKGDLWRCGCFSQRRFPFSRDDRDTFFGQRKKKILE